MMMLVMGCGPTWGAYPIQPSTLSRYTVQQIKRRLSLYQDAGLAKIARLGNDLDNFVQTISPTANTYEVQPVQIVLHSQQMVSPPPPSADRQPPRDIPITPVNPKYPRHEINSWPTRLSDTRRRS